MQVALPPAPTFPQDLDWKSVDYEFAASDADDAPTVGRLPSNERLSCRAPSSSWGHALFRRDFAMPKFWLALISAIENAWIPQLEAAGGRLSALTVHLPEVAIRRAEQQANDFIGGKGGDSNPRPRHYEQRPVKKPSKFRYLAFAIRPMCPFVAL